MRQITVLCTLLATVISGAAFGQGNNPGGGKDGGQGQGQTGLTLGSVVPMRRVPQEDYYNGFVPYNLGDFVSARNVFQRAAQGGIRSTEGRWVDSICYHAMLGECYYQMGDYTQSLDQHTSALKLYLAHQDWLLRVQWPQTLSPLQAAIKFPITWGTSSRRVTFARFPDTISSFQGRLDNSAVLSQGGVFQQPQMYPVNVMEILRCTTLSLRRRMELMGSVCQHDPLTSQLVDAISRRQTTANHWSQAFLGVQLGIALAAAGKGGPAVSELQNSLLAGGQFEHPLSSTALLELGKLTFSAGQYEVAATYFAEATFSAAIFAQTDMVHYDVMEEAFRGGMQTHLVAGAKTLYPPLLPAALWAQRNSLPLQVSLLTMAADNMLAMGETNTAMARLADARRIIGRRECLLGAAGARLQYETAKLQYQLGNLTTGNAAVSAVTSYFQRGGSKRMFQIGLADLFLGQGLLSERVADQLFTELLREPQPADWAVEPAETLAVEMTPHQLQFEHWGELAMLREIARDRREPDKTLEIIERIRRHRFFTSQELGGRVMAIRWVLEAPKEALPERAVLQRQDLLAKYPKYGELARQASQLRQEIAAAPLVATDDETATKQQALRLDKLAKLAAVQEVVVHDMALNRHPADVAFPPQLDLKTLQSKLRKGQLLLAYYNGSRTVLGFAITHDKYTSWNFETPNKVRGDIAECLKHMGLVDRNKAIDGKDLKDDAWKKLARRLLPILTNNTPDEAWNQFDEVIIVPDGLLWYFPFEALPVGGDNQTSYTPLISKVRIRYSPTVALAVPDGRLIKPRMTTAAVAGKLFPKDHIEVSIGAVEDLGKVLPQVTRLMPKPIGPSSLLAKFFDRLVVYHDMDDAEKVASPFEWSPVQLDKGKPGSSLASWLPLPWGGPEQLTFPGFHTSAESGTKKIGTGDEIFLTTCGLMSTGARTVMLSRWRTGGQVAYDLVREYMQELPHSSASAAWQRSVQLRMRTDVDLSLEPRVKLGPNEETIKPEHPFFWSGYLVVDTGVNLKKEETPNAPKVPVVGTK